MPTRWLARRHDGRMTKMIDRIRPTYDDRTSFSVGDYHRAIASKNTTPTGEGAPLPRQLATLLCQMKSRSAVAYRDDNATTGKRFHHTT